jgi:hypothetical protein
MIGAGRARGAALTRSCSPSRASSRWPSVIDVNQRIAALDSMLRRTLGEHIEIEIVRGAGLWPAMVDPAQLESARAQPVPECARRHAAPAAS